MFQQRDARDYFKHVTSPLMAYRSSWASSTGLVAPNRTHRLLPEQLWKASCPSRFAGPPAPHVFANPWDYD